MEKYRFYHIPKTGGTAIFNMTTKWKNHKRAHPNINHIMTKHYPPEQDEIGYAVIRHPYSRFVSAFYHMVDACNDEFYYKNATVSDCDWLQKNDINMSIFYNDPNEFLLALSDHKNPHHILAKKIFFKFDIFRPQFYWLQNNNSNGIDPNIKILLNHENLKNEFTIIANSLGEKAVWPEGKSSNSRITKTTIPLTDKSKEIIRNIYNRDFKYLKFEK